MKWRMGAMVFLVLLLVAARTSIVFVDQAEYVYITCFGRPIVTWDGQHDAGMHWKWPFPVESALRLDRRLDLLEIPTQELLIRDRDENGSDKPLPITFDLFVCWRIGSIDSGQDSQAVDRFVRSFGSTERARTFLRSQIISRLKVELSQVALSELLNTDPRQIRLRELLLKIRNEPYASGENDPSSARLSLQQRADRLGIAIMDVGMKRFNHPVQVRSEFFAKIREERKREANLYRLQGEEIASKIRADGDKEAKRIRAEAEADRIRMEGQAEADATRILNDAARHAPELYKLVRLLRGYQKMFGDDRTQLILSLDHPLLKWFKEVPGLNPSQKEPIAPLSNPGLMFPSGPSTNVEPTNKPPARNPKQ